MTFVASAPREGRNLVTFVYANTGAPAPSATCHVLRATGCFVHLLKCFVLTTLRVPQWFDQQFKKPKSNLFFVALDTSLCNAWQANAFQVSFWWPYIGCCVPRSFTYRFPDTAHQMHDTYTAQSTFHRRVLNRVIHRTITNSHAFSVNYYALRSSLLHFLLPSLPFSSRVCVCSCVCVRVCVSGCVYVWSKRNESERLDMRTCNRQ